MHRALYMGAGKHGRQSLAVASNVKLPNTHSHVLHMQTTLYFCLCLQFLQPAACWLLVCIASYSELPPLG